MLFNLNALKFWYYNAVANKEEENKKEISIFNKKIDISNTIPEQIYTVYNYKTDMYYKLNGAGIYKMNTQMQNYLSKNIIRHI